MVIVVAMVMVIASYQVLATAKIDSEIASNEAIYYNLENLMIFSASLGNLISNGANCTLAYSESSQASRLDGINETLSEGVITLRSYSKPYAVSVLQCSNLST